MDLQRAFEAVVAKVQEWIEDAIIMLPNLVVAVIVMTAFWLAARVISNLLRRALGRVTRHDELSRLLANIVWFATLAAGLFVSLGILELEKTVTSLLAGAGIIGLALGFAFQDIASNFIAGILLLLRRPFRIGTLIRTNDYYGVVQHINLRATILRTLDGQIVLIPNKDVFQNPIVNYTKVGKRRVDIPVGVSYGDDLALAKQAAMEAVEGVSPRDTTQPVELFYEGFGDHSINFSLRFWIDFARETDYLQARSDAVMRIKAAFDTHGITIPFPIRTLDFGIVGGEKLSDVLPKSMYGG